MVGFFSTRAAKEKSVRQTQRSLQNSKRQPADHGSESDVMFLQRTIGNRAFGHMLNLSMSRFSRIQAKLAINQPGDRYEQEADRVAEQVMRMSEPQMQRTCPCSGGCPKRQTEKLAQGHQRLLTKHARSSALELSAEPSLALDVLRSPGQPLDPATRGFMEARFAHDFSHVRVHSDTVAEQSARDMNARAYTVAQHIVFNTGQFAPGTYEGQRLLAHELTHVVQQNSGATVGVARQRMDPRHARGYAGEQGMGFIHYRREEGWILFEGPGGSAGHGVTERGFDAVAYNTRTGEIHLVDNKSLGRQGNVSSATAIDPTRNLPKNLDGLIQRVEAAKDVPGRIRLLGRLRALKAALAAGKPLPNDVKLVVTTVGGRSTGVTRRLQSVGVQHLPEPKPKTPPVATTPVKPPAATTPPSTLVPTVKPLPTPGPAPVVQPPPVVAPPVRPSSTWKAGLQAGGKALGVALVFAGLEYLVRRRLEKDLEAAIDKARHGAMPWAQRLKREDPLKPVYMRVKIEAKDYSRYVPLLGWMPETPVLHMLQIAMVREVIDPPIVEVQDNRLDILHPGVTTTVTYTELMVP
ncbi:MAG: DUF4157 domain-containing protein [candidate division KSB1 bacterium]|nr:DUF4157 domain-containing protein [candidate division KSB1 bacterium]MDZ7273995.1 DUF4157 domain-containing protein [candidate division KSB1 bacterium]MDZ7286368.1 DUF4157 domain-containing protein [candidate division KSB1 bacterium]MDZ7296596.1 DUF4157 domain-containing protein [candidate division KSB1 bacterium]MDZ7309071.1 DUF4157 domain-containing protein [candidate division KSB1 bacterium]